jgi:hypothetical protein
MKKLSELPVLSRRRRIEVLLETYRDVLEEDGPLPVLGGRPKSCRLHHLGHSGGRDTIAILTPGPTSKRPLGLHHSAQDLFPPGDHGGAVAESVSLIEASVKPGSAHYRHGAVPKALGLGIPCPGVTVASWWPAVSTVGSTEIPLSPIVPPPVRRSRGR